MTTATARSAAVASAVWATLVPLLLAQEPAVFRSTTNVVVVPTTVTRRDGRFAFGLTKEDFQIREDGSPAEIVQFSAERAPVSIGILLDISGSMVGAAQRQAADERRWADTRGALEMLVGRLDSRDEVFFAVFNDKTALALPWTQNHSAVLRTFDTLKPGGRTAMVDAVKLIAPAFQLARHNRKVLLLISDGQDSTAPASAVSPRGQWTTYMGVPLHVAAPSGAAERTAVLLFNARLETVKRAIDQSGAALYSIGAVTRRGAQVNVRLLQALSAPSGGYVERLADPAQIPDAMARICDELQAQYVLAFAPSHADGQVHKISVTTRELSLRVRARTNYVAAAAAPPR